MQLVATTLANINSVGHYEPLINITGVIPKAIGRWNLRKKISAGFMVALVALTPGQTCWMLTISASSSQVSGATVEKHLMVWKLIQKKQGAIWRVVLFVNSLWKGPQKSRAQVKLKEQPFLAQLKTLNSNAHIWYFLLFKNEIKQNRKSTTELTWTHPHVQGWKMFCPSWNVKSPVRCVRPQFSTKHGVLKRFFPLSKVYPESENPSGQDP